MASLTGLPVHQFTATSCNIHQQCPPGILVIVQFFSHPHVSPLLTLSFHLKPSQSLLLSLRINIPVTHFQMLPSHSLNLHLIHMLLSPIFSSSHMPPSLSLSLNLILMPLSLLFSLSLIPPSLSLNLIHMPPVPVYHCFKFNCPPAYQLVQPTSHLSLPTHFSSSASGYPTCTQAESAPCWPKKYLNYDIRGNSQDQKQRTPAHVEILPPI